MQYFWCVFIPKWVLILFCYYCYLCGYFKYWTFQFIISSVKNRVVSEVRSNRVKQYDWFNVFDVFIVILQFVRIIFCFDFLFILILPIVHFELTVFIVETIIRDRVVSQLIIIWVITFYYVYIWILHCILFYFILLLFYSFCHRSFLLGHNLCSAIYLLQHCQEQFSMCSCLLRI